MKRKLSILLLSSATMIASTVCPLAAMAAQPAISDLIIADRFDDIEEPVVASPEDNDAIEVFYDAEGNTVLSNLPVPYEATPREQLTQLKDLNRIFSNEARTVADINWYTTTGRVDREYNPIYIGTWNGTACYARHTLGDYFSSGYLLTYGYASWYNTKGYNALPYRNGAANNGSGQGVVDVARYSNFSIRDLDTNVGYTLKVNDWGPNQRYFPDRIADLDKNTFLNMHGNTSDGLLYCRTWVPLTRYNP